VVSPRSSEPFAHVVVGYQVAKIDGNNGTGKVARQYAFCHIVRLTALQFLTNVLLPDMPSKMLTSSKTQITRRIIRTPESLRLLLF
jgi:hypothetical protein